MKEVSCKFFETLLADLRRRRIDPSGLVRHTPYSVAHLGNKDERIDWPAFRTIMANGRAFWSNDALVELGVRSTESPLVQFIGVVARIRFSVAEFYAWVGAPKGISRQMIDCVTSRTTPRGPGRVRIEFDMLPGYPPCEELFLVSKGTFGAMPRMLGAPPATVDMTVTPTGVCYEIQFTEPRGLATVMRKAVRWPLNVRQAADELALAHESLTARYADLEEARATVERQRALLATAYDLGQRIWGQRAPQVTIHTIAETLVAHAPFRGVELVVSSVTGDDERCATGACTGDDALVIELTGRETVTGSLRSWPRPDADPAEARALLELIAPTIALAIANAIAYRQLASYQADLERRVELRTRDLRAARDELAETVSQLEEAQTARDRLLQNVSHEIRTPLSLILLSAQTVLGAHRASLGDDGVAALDRITTSARKLTRMIDEMLLLAASSENELPIRPEPVDVRATATELVASWRTVAASAGLTLELIAPPRALGVFDPLALDRVLSNLLSNAIKFTPAGGAVTVEIVDLGPRLEVRVQDTGVGIDDALRSKLFGRFEQGAAGRRLRVGSGLGLSIVRELVRAHGGATTYRPMPTGGSEFTFDLRAARDAPAAVRGATVLRPSDFGVQPLAAAQAAPVPRTPIGVSHGCVLVAEDDPDLGAAVVEILADEYTVILAPDGMTALSLAEQYRPDILVTDVQMPGIDGFTLTTRFRELPGRLPAPVLILSARAELGDRIAGLGAGAIDYLVKPFEPSELRARVRAQLAHRALVERLHRAEKLASFGELSAGLAHELRNPANGIVNAVGPLRMLLPPDLLAPGEAVGELIAVMSDCAEQIAFVSRQLLGFRRGGEVELRRVAIGDVIQRSLANASAALATLDFRPTFEYIGQIRCAAPLLVQVLVNLLDNAAHAAGPGGWVELATRLDGDRVLIEVSDSGPGVPPHLRERVFEPFFTTKAPGQGTGLGLATSRDLVHRHGGTLEIRQRGDRCVFTVALPHPPPQG